MILVTHSPAKELTILKEMKFIPLKVTSPNQNPGSIHIAMYAGKYETDPFCSTFPS